MQLAVDSGAAKSVWPSRKKGVERTKSTRTVDGKKCSMRFLDADVKRPLASVSAFSVRGSGGGRDEQRGRDARTL